jgi:hypothetical protein
VAHPLAPELAPDGVSTGPAHPPCRASVRVVKVDPPFDGALTWASASAAGSHFFPGRVSQSEQERGYDVHRRARRDAEPFKTWRADHSRTARLGAFVALADDALGGRAGPRPGPIRN